MINGQSEHGQLNSFVPGVDCGVPLLVVGPLVVVLGLVGVVLVGVVLFCVVLVDVLVVWLVGSDLLVDSDSNMKGKNHLQSILSMNAG